MNYINEDKTIFQDNKGRMLYWDDLDDMSVLDIEERGIHVAEN